jgi:hypothetical protein
MNDDQSVEQRLASAYAVVPGQGFVSTDRRIGALTAVAASRRPWRRRPLRVALPLAAAFVVLAGAAVGGMHLLDLLATGTPGTAVAWDKGVAIGQRQEHGNYVVTLARGYADLNQVVLGVSVERVDKGAVRDAGFVLELRDPAWVVLAPGAVPALGANQTNVQAEMISFAPTTSSDGEYTLRFGIAADGGKSDMPLTFRFKLPAPAGAIAHVDQTLTADGGSVGVADVRLSPTMITASIHLEPSDREASAWAAIGYFKHGDETVRIDWGTRTGPSDMDQTAGTYAGIAEPAGAWTLVITEIVGDRSDGTQVRLQGPWEFSFTVR